MGGDSVMAGVDLRGTQVSELAITRREFRVAVERLGDVDETFEDAGIRAKDLEDVEHRKAEILHLLILGTDCGRSVVRFDQGNASHREYLVGGECVDEVSEGVGG